MLTCCHASDSPILPVSFSPWPLPVNRNWWPLAAMVARLYISVAEPHVGCGMAPEINPRNFITTIYQSNILKPVEAVNL